MLSTIYLALGCFVLILGYFIFSNNKLARFYSIGAITPFLGILYVTISSVLGFKDIQQYGGVFIGLGPVLALGLAMVYRFKIVVDEKLQAEEETKALLSNQNVILEDQVKKRTAELSRSLENLKTTQAQLIQSEKMASLGELTAGIAHEIQNPLNFVNNFSEVSKELALELNDEVGKNGEIDRKLVEEIAQDIFQNQEKIHHHGKRAEDIVKSMLMHSRTSSGEKELTNINSLCDEYLRLAYQGMRAKDKSFNIKFETFFGPGLPLVEVIPQDIGRVLLNLVNNAFQACAEQLRTNLTDLADPGDPANLSDLNRYKPMVSISTKLSPEPGLNSSKQGKVAAGQSLKATDGVDSSGSKFLAITISDNGPGIPAEIKDKIFQPFFTTKPAGQGTGLGLSLSYDIIKAHGGQLNVHSEEGGGSEFIITLPINSQ
ncbi:MAG: hypothetical protein IPL46_22310 [Saprospiraceae bacterium]|nr:hypothetical protein [Saprospiraceae bacterium]